MSEPAPRRPFRRPQPTISLCVASGGPAARTRALLEIVRPHVDEIVLAVDAAAKQDTLERCRDLADRRIAFTQDRASSASLWGWVFEQASADWVLRMDDDELPSRALLGALPELVRDRRLTQYRLRRRWLWPDAATLIDEAPWSIEYIPRLTRTVHGLVAYSGTRHSDETAAGESRMVDAAFYHADLLAKDEATRRRKVLVHEEDAPGLVFAGMSVNALYLPEAAEALRTVPAPDEDREAVEALLSPSGDAPGDPALAPVEEVGADAIRLPILARPVSPGTYRARIELPEPPPSLRAGGLHHVLVLVHNLGDERWPAGDRPERPIRLGYRWTKADEEAVTFDGRGVFLETVLPGAVVHHHLAIRVPPEPGVYRFEVDLVHEHVRWFGTSTRHEIEITPPAADAEPMLAVQREQHQVREIARLRLELRGQGTSEIQRLRAALERLRAEQAEAVGRLEAEVAGADRSRLTRLIDHLQAQIDSLEAENARLRLGAATSHPAAGA